MNLHKQLFQEVSLAINTIINRLQKEQSPSGPWHYCFENSSFTDAYMIILLRTLELPDEDVIRSLTKRIAHQQQPNGAWKLYHDEIGGNLSATIDCYYALLISGYHHRDEPHMEAARKFIFAKGGVKQLGPFTRIILAATGQAPYPAHFHIPIELVLLPTTFPLNFFDLPGYARAHFAPSVILADQRFCLQSKYTPDLSELLLPNDYYEYELGIDGWSDRNSDQNRSLINQVMELIGELPILPEEIHTLALDYLEKYMLERIDENGTLFSYASTTFLMIFALLALGYRKNHPIITRAIAGIKTMLFPIDGTVHLQNSPSTVWDTALLSSALQEAGVSPIHPMIRKANHYLLSRQHYKYGDWAVHNRKATPGGWGFSDINTFVPDVDDSTAALRAICRSAVYDPIFNQAWNRGVKWVLSMQNDDGGWPAFERNTNKEIFTYLPVVGAKDILVDPSSADLTGRTLEFLGNYAGFTTENKQVEKAIKWLIDHQEDDGSWYSRWGISYIYGTWAAITGLNAVGVRPNHPTIQKGVKWLFKIQNQDGGWGESCKSDAARRYIPLGASTPSQTAWALDALIAVYDEPVPSITHGIRYLVNSSKVNDWTTEYPTGSALPRYIYIHYHSYQYIWPLLTLAHYRNKYFSK